MVRIRIGVWLRVSRYAEARERGDEEIQIKQVFNGIKKPRNTGNIETSKLRIRPDPRDRETRGLSRRTKRGVN